MGLVPASYKVTARSVRRVLSDGRRQSDRSLKGHEAGVQKGQPWAANHHRKIVAVYERADPSWRRLLPGGSPPPSLVGAKRQVASSTLAPAALIQTWIIPQRTIPPRIAISRCRSAEWSPQR